MDLNCKVKRILILLIWLLGDKDIENLHCSLRDLNAETHNQDLITHASKHQDLHLIYHSLIREPKPTIILPTPQTSKIPIVAHYPRLRSRSTQSLITHASDQDPHSHSLPTPQIKIHTVTHYPRPRSRSTQSLITHASDQDPHSHSLPTPQIKIHTVTHYPRLRSRSTQSLITHAPDQDPHSHSLPTPQIKIHTVTHYPRPRSRSTQSLITHASDQDPHSHSLPTPQIKIHIITQTKKAQKSTHYPHLKPQRT
ncbi:uncharacterized protein LOC129972779 [Argiope bruennichi]|uniref:uncharacterized protein LOC129972779 n=1 Tax=Argiope bruennichi TaxID=94029 RepID=UPI00249420DF|nr:uncharacterized protein LOC129972779 [Argiope bruennichi]